MANNLVSRYAELEEALQKYENKNREITHELNNKRDDLNKCRQELQEALLKQNDLEHQLKNEKKKSSAEAINKNILQKFNETLQIENHKFAKRVYDLEEERNFYEIENKEYLEQTRNLILNNLNLKQEVNDLNNQLGCHSKFQNSIKEDISNIFNRLNIIAESMEVLNSKYKEVEKLNEYLKTESQLLSITKEAIALKTKAEKQRDEYQNLLEKKSAELSKCSEMLNSVPENYLNHSNISDYWEKQVAILQENLQKELKISEELTDALNKSMGNETYFRKRCQTYEEEYKKIENELKIQKQLIIQGNDQGTEEHEVDTIFVMDLEK